MAEASKVRIDLAETGRLDVPRLRRRPGTARLLILADAVSLLLGPRLSAAQAAQASGYEVHIAAPHLADHGLNGSGLGIWDIPERPRAGVLKVLRHIRLYGALIDALKPDLVHCLGLGAVAYGGLAARLRRLPAVLSLPGVAQGAESGKALKLSRRSLGHLMQKAGMALAIGNPRASVVLQTALDRPRALTSRSQPQRRPFLIRGAASDLTRFRPCLPAERRPGPPVVLFTSDRLGAADIHVFAAAAALLHAKGLPGRFVVMGEPRPDQPGAIGIEELAAYQEAGVVEWWGQPADAAPTLRQADIFCLPGGYAGEIPTPLVEALATGLPVVAGDCPSLRSMVRHGVNGLLVAPRDAQALAGALERMIGDAEFRQSAASRSREIAEAEFSLDNFLTASLIVYRATLGAVPATRVRLEPQRSSDCPSD